jgi:hypothetical protein
MGSLEAYESSSYESSWYKKLGFEVEIGNILSTSSGTIKNATSSDFKSDYGYSDTKASYFAISFRPNYQYIPNVDISYSNILDNNQASLDRNVTVVQKTYAGSVSTIIESSVANIIFYKEFKSKGDRWLFLGRKFYPGDLAVDVGVNIKYIDFMFMIRDNTIAGDNYRFDGVNSIIPLPYIGFRYYYYRLRLFGGTSSLSFVNAKSTNYQFGADFRVIDDLYLSASYIYEDFEATEKDDKTNFKIYGNKFSFKYDF